MISPDDDSFSPLSPRSLKDEFIERFEALILSGKFAPGERVPSERNLGQMFGISRPVVHEGLRTLESRGLVTIESRKGVRVNDYRREGSIEMLLSMLNFTGGRLSPGLFEGVLEMRLLFEVETARLAAARRGEGALAELRACVERERMPERRSPREIADLDFEFHLAVAMASANEIYPLLMNSFKRIYGDILASFYAEAAALEPIYDFHARIVEAIAARDEAGARELMSELLRYSEAELRRLIFGQPAPTA